MGRHYVSEAVVRSGFFDASLKKSGVNDGRRSPTEAFKCVSLRCILENQKEHFGFLPLQKCVYRGWKKPSFWKTPFVRKLWTHHSPSRLAAAHFISFTLWGGLSVFFKNGCFCEKTDVWGLAGRGSDRPKSRVSPRVVWGSVGICGVSLGSSKRLPKTDVVLGRRFHPFL